MTCEYIKHNIYSTTIASVSNHIGSVINSTCITNAVPLWCVFNSKHSPTGISA